MLTVFFLLFIGLVAIGAVVLAMKTGNKNSRKGQSAESAVNDQMQAGKDRPVS